MCLREGRLRLGEEEEAFGERRTERERERKSTEGVEHKNRKVTRTSRRKNFM